MKKIYIVLIQAHTGLGSIARKITRYPYTHIAVTFDKSMTDFISFSRKYHYFPFEAGITHEYRNYYAFGRFSDFRAKVFELALDDAHFDAVSKYISDCEKDENMQFNVLSMATMPLIGGFHIPHSENCMSFTSRCIGLSGCAKMKRRYWRYSIKDIDEMLSDYLLFEGKITRGEAADDGYMTPFEPVRYVKGMIKHFSKLLIRIIFI